LDVRSRLTAPVTVVPIDRSEPPAPAMAEVVWIDAGPAGVGAPPVWTVRLTLQAPDTTASVLVERRPDGDTRWRNAPVEDRGGWQPWPAATDTLVVHDRAANPSLTWSYRARRRTEDGRPSAPSTATTLTPPT
jgi:hypothetical protein